jgi:hypothetical protein
MQRACTDFNYEELRALLLLAVQEYAPQCGIEDLIWSKKNQLAEAQREIKVVENPRYQLR